MTIRRTLMIAATAAALGFSLSNTLTATAVTPEAATQVRQVPGVDNFLNIVSGDGCSMSVVRFDVSQPTDKIMIMTNGHCIDPQPGYNGDFKQNIRGNNSYDLLNKDGKKAGVLKTTQMIYGTMTGTDIAFYEGTDTYADLKSRYGIDGLTISRQTPKMGDRIVVASGYWKKLYKCTVDRIANAIEPDGPNKWWESPAWGYNHVPTCKTIGGTSGSPVVDATTGLVVSINNSGNDKPVSGCSGTTTCEVDAQGRKTAVGNTGYSVPTDIVYTCINASTRRIDVKTPGCKLAGGDSAVKRPW